MTDDIQTLELAPLEELLEILPRIEAAKQRARLGNALDRATASVERLSHYPARLTDLAILASATESGLETLRADIEQTLVSMSNMAKVLAGQPTVEELDHINQVGLIQLPLQMEKIEERIETAWRRTIQEALGGQAALGEVLTNIRGVEALGRELTGLAVRARRIEDKTRPAASRVAERNDLVARVSELANRLLDAEIAPPVANFLVAVAAGPVKLSDLKDDIYAWIKDHDALALFTVSVRGA